MFDWDGLDWKANYSPGQIRSVIQSLGVKIDYETGNDFICYCPFHDNTHSASFSISKSTGLYICFNPACESKGSLIRLVCALRSVGEPEAKMLIAKADCDEPEDIEDTISSLLSEEDLPEFSPETITALAKALPNSDGEKYMVEQRGFRPETLKYFNVGFSQKKNCVTVPVASIDGIYLGFVARRIDKKVFQNTNGLPKSKTAFNIQNAKKHDTVIIVESSFDAMRVHQAGYPNVIALLGGNISDVQIAIIRRFFTRVIIMTDDDKKNLIFFQRCPKCKKRGKSCVGHNPGRELGESMAAKLKDIDVYWANYDAADIYPHNAKDASDMTDKEIAQCIRNAVPNYEYVLSSVL